MAGHYREQIESGALPPGEMLPSINRIAHEWAVSTATVEKALRKLREEQLVKGIHGIGTEVLGVRVPISSGAERHDRSGRTQSSWGAGEKSSDHTGGVVQAPADVASVFGISPGEGIIRRSRVYRDTHGIVSHSTSWIPKEFLE
ncbi:GntR family transcriptional regulator, partial [Streptomyces sp. DSM 41033]|uniref:GntR family transcriptional regulator n=1 Tax=Streptomyces sp. DSM 41033 TaxID=3448655 RepID=UPI0040402953